MSTRYELFRKAVCDAIDALCPEGCDYTLTEVACWVGCGTTVDGDCLRNAETVLEMDGSRWLEAGHQHSTYKQWRPK